MGAELFLRGLLIGFSVAAPVGPIGVPCTRRTLAEGRAACLATGLGEATADALYGAVAACGLTAISDTLAQDRFGLFLRLVIGRHDGAVALQLRDEAGGRITFRARKVSGHCRRGADSPENVSPPTRAASIR